MTQASTIPNSTAPGRMTDFAELRSRLSANAGNLDANARRQMALLAFGRLASTQPHLPVLYEDAFSLLCETLNAELGGLGEVDADERSLILRMARFDFDGRSPWANRAAKLDPMSSMAAYAMAENCAVISPELGQESRFVDPLLGESGVVSALTIPLPLGERPFGTIGIYSRQPHEFGQEDVQFAETLVHLLTAAIGRILAEAKTLEQESDEGQPRSEPAEKPTSKELRSSPRRRFSYSQLVAPMYGDGIPPRHRFFEVPCRDISRGGISFFLDHQPDFTHLVVALGRAPDLAYVTARITRIVEPATGEPFLIACQFTGRVHI